MYFSRFSSWLIFYVLTVPLHSQDRPWVELSVSLPYAANISNEGKFSPTIYLPINYIVNPRLTVGLFFLNEEFVTSHPVGLYRTDTSDHFEPVRYDGGGEKIKHTYQVTGYGINLKYNLLVNPNYRIFLGFQYGLFSTSLSDNSNAREYTYETLSGTATYISEPLPFENKSHASLNFNLGCDFRLNRTIWLYLMFDYQDVNKTMDYYYRVDVHKSVDHSSSQTYERIDEVTYTEQKDEEVDLVMHLQFGLRFYMFDKKR